MLPCTGRKPRIDRLSTCHEALADAALPLQRLQDAPHDVPVVRVLHADVDVGAAARVRLEGLGQEAGRQAVPLAHRGDRLPHVDHVVCRLDPCAVTIPLLHFDAAMQGVKCRLTGGVLAGRVSWTIRNISSFIARL